VKIFIIIFKVLVASLEEKRMEGFAKNEGVSRRNGVH